MGHRKGDWGGHWSHRAGKQLGSNLNGICPICANVHDDRFQ